ncbi:hypothetical protein DOY81_014381 [Sarcophaga bullata]|nr:hypothetical protein DOY81_014381 [Sarcophaga bullata]
MSKKFGICCVNCQIPLNNEDKIFGTSCGHLYHFPCIRSNHDKSTKCMHCEAYKPMIFPMHLRFEDSPLAGKLLEKNIEIINKLNYYEGNNVLLRSSYNAARYSIQQLESKVKTLKDGLQAKDAVVNELQDRMEILEALNQCLSKKNYDNPGLIFKQFHQQQQQQQETS